MIFIYLILQMKSFKYQKFLPYNTTLENDYYYYIVIPVWSCLFKSNIFN